MSNPLLLRRRAMMQSKKDNILTFTAKAANGSVQLTAVGSPSAVTLEYNLNGSGWLPYTIGEVISLPNVGDNVKMRGNNTTFSTSGSNFYNFVIEGLVSANGDVTSLQNELGGDIALTSYCYSFLFKGCTGLTQAPALPSTTLGRACYLSMFQECTSLTQAPVLPATTLVLGCYNSMFSGCTALTSAPALPATTLNPDCYNSMFSGCTALTSAPALPATTLARSCYVSMFYDCTGITSHDVATLNNSGNVFYDNTACASLTVHADTPPVIGGTTITGLKADCKIYVPYSADHSILNAYNTAQYWRDRADYIFELDENGEIPS